MLTFTEIWDRKETSIHFLIQKTLSVFLINFNSSEYLQHLWQAYEFSISTESFADGANNFSMKNMIHR